MTRPLVFIDFDGVINQFPDDKVIRRQGRTDWMEPDDPALRLALCGRLHAALALLQPTLHDPIPPHLTESLTVDTLPATPEHFISEPDSLCEYCLALLQLLLERPAEPKMEQTLTGLLCELVWYFTEGLKAPRWLRTADGVKFISEVAA